LRDAELALDTEITDALLATVDAIREYLAVFESTSTDEGPDTDALIATLVSLAEPTTTPGAPVETEAEADVAVLDDLMNLVGELVLTRNEIEEAGGAQRYSGGRFSRKARMPSAGSPVRLQ
jgi:chemotaxis protein histidine kinase CheA